MFCSLCAADNPNKGRFCVKCGAVLQGQRGMPPPGLGFDVPAASYSGPTEMSGKAIVSLICGIVFFFFPSAIAAIILGHLSLGDIRRSGGRLTGSGLATTGLVMGYAGLSVIPIMIIAAIAIPNLLRARRAANEASAIGSVRTIETAAIIYKATYSNGYPPSFDAMSEDRNARVSCDHAKLLDWSMESGKKDGYAFKYVPPYEPGVALLNSDRTVAKGCREVGVESFQVHADPIARGKTGQRSFYADQTGVIRSNSEAPATSDSPPLE